MDVTSTRGRVEVGYADGCTGACATGGAQNFDALATIARQAGELAVCRVRRGDDVDEDEEMIRVRAGALMLATAAALAGCGGGGDEPRRSGRSRLSAASQGTLGVRCRLRGRGDARATPHRAPQ